jgi:hypothetical protein
MVDFHVDTKSEYLYYCIDTSRTPGLFHMLINAGIPIPTEVIQAYSMINQIQQTLNFLNIQFRFEGLIITTGNYATYNAANMK